MQPAEKILDAEGTATKIQKEKTGSKEPRLARTKLRPKINPDFIEEQTPADQIVPIQVRALGDEHFHQKREIPLL